jgi:hypothetical protein
MVGDSWIVWKCFVLPGVDETLTFFSPIRELMVLDFPTFGYPTSPTTILGGDLPSLSAKSLVGDPNCQKHAVTVPITRIPANGGADLTNRSSSSNTVSTRVRASSFGSFFIKL